MPCEHFFSKSLHRCLNNPIRYSVSQTGLYRVAAVPREFRFLIPGSKRSHNGRSTSDPECRGGHLVSRTRHRSMCARGSLDRGVRTLTRCAWSGAVFAPSKAWRPLVFTPHAQLLFRRGTLALRRTDCAVLIRRAQRRLTEYTRIPLLVAN